MGDLRVWQGLRVPAGRGRREIDHVILNPHGLHVLEVKHWSGSVSLQPDGGWVQTRLNGSTVNHGDVLATHDAKVSALLAYLRGQGVELPAAAVHRRVLLTNESCTLPPELAAAGVLGCAGVSSYLRTFGESVLTNLAGRLLPTSLTGRKVDAVLVRSRGSRWRREREGEEREDDGRRVRERARFSERECVCASTCAWRGRAGGDGTDAGARAVFVAQMGRAAAALDALGTWDALTLNGGRTLHGDAHGFSCGGKPHV
eukprot:5161496-Prymnesium_polylepis.1